MIEVNTKQEKNRTSNQSTSLKWLAIVVSFLVVGGGGVGVGIWISSKDQTELKAQEKKNEHEESEEDHGKIILEADSVTALGIDVEVVQSKPLTTEFTVTGTVEANEYQVQNITPLVSGVVSEVFVRLGDHVKKGQPIIVLSSPEAASLHGRLHEAETREQLAEKELERVMKVENKAGILKAKANMEKAEADLERLSLLEKKGIAAKKDVIAAKTEHRRATAEYEYQSDIALNREIAKAVAELETAKAELSHIRSGLRSIGALKGEHANKDSHDTAKVVLSTPMAGTVIGRTVNPGIGVSAGKSLITIADLSNVWIIANVPESQIEYLRLGQPAKVQTSTLRKNTILGRVAYIDPRLDGETRTAKVRIEVENRLNLLKVDSFVEVVITTTQEINSPSKSIWVIEDAIQKVQDRSVVFVKRSENSFEMQEVVIGRKQGVYVEVKKGLIGGDRVVAKGAFKLKSIILKEEIGEGHGH